MDKTTIEVTLPKPRAPGEVTLDPRDLAAGRYGTHEQVQIWGPEQTFAYILRVQAQAVATLSELHPDIVPSEVAAEIVSKATLEHVRPERIRELEERTGHDVIAISTALEEVLSPSARPFVGMARTSADSTQTARALQVKAALEVIVDSVENLRDILIEKASSWINPPHMDTTHLYDALPTVVGRPFVHYAEMLQSDLERLKFVYDHSIIGKWSDATGNHHAATILGIDGIRLEQRYCERLGISHMIAAAQVPGLEFEADIVFALTRTAATLNNIARYIADGRGDDQNVFVNTNPRRSKGSSAMPHKDVKNGNPTAEEQTVSVWNDMAGWLVTAMMNCQMPYARALYASANGRIRFEDGFKFLDHGIRGLANITYWLGLNEERCKQRIERSHGVVTSPIVLAYVTDFRKVAIPMARSEAHDLVGRLATEAYNAKVSFIDVLLRSPEITSRLDEVTLRRITNPLTYAGESKRIVAMVRENYYCKKTLGE